ncbi:TlpA family protein disulfide reductase [Lewinella sp. IMCC34183]|uniref:TlpA family protein disulfide reductase n=1 Tax=Lewinella sp. IMCC34183 TaxID=2248762 RepID=UPI001300A39F|nr:TlpA disulfide reductase family protein [Lewinella sp. IMCC34183]
MTKIALQLLLAVFAVGAPLSGQDVGYYLNEMNTDPSIDTTFNRYIDSLWEQSNAGAIDTTSYREPVRSLRAYYDRHANEITGDKAELYAYFMLLKEEDYPPIIERFEAKRGEYDHRVLTTVGEIYRRAVVAHTGGNLSAVTARVDNLYASGTSETFRAWVQSYLGIPPGQRSPDFRMTDAAGRSYDLDALRGKVIVLDFWATWCPPCVAQLPHMKELNDKYRDEDFVLISVSRDSEPELWRDFLASHELPWPQVIDDETKEGNRRKSGTLTTLFGAGSLPKYVLIDKEGIVRYDSHRNDMQPVTAELIERYLR